VQLSQREREHVRHHVFVGSVHVGVRVTMPVAMLNARQ
jgi:hypothetical protein